MKQFALLFTTVLAITLFTACDDDTPDHMDDPSTELDYEISVMEPNTDDKHVGDSLSININFESMTDMTVHHIKVRIYNIDTNEEIYNKPDDAHVHTEGSYNYTDIIALNTDNGVMAHTDWTLEAKVWGHEAGLGEVIEEVQFHVHPE